MCWSQKELEPYASFPVLSPLFTTDTKVWLLLTLSMMTFLPKSVNIWANVTPLSGRRVGHHPASLRYPEKQELKSQVRQIRHVTPTPVSFPPGHIILPPWGANESSGRSPYGTHEDSQTTSNSLSEREGAYNCLQDIRHPRASRLRWRKLTLASNSSLHWAFPPKPHSLHQIPRSPDPSLHLTHPEYSFPSKSTSVLT